MLATDGNFHNPNIFLEVMKKGMIPHQQLQKFPETPGAIRSNTMEDKSKKKMQRMKSQPVNRRASREHQLKEKIVKDQFRRHSLMDMRKPVRQRRGSLTGIEHGIIHRKNSLTGNEKVPQGIVIPKRRRRFSTGYIGDEAKTQIHKIVVDAETRRKYGKEFVWKKSTHGNKAIREAEKRRRSVEARLKMTQDEKRKFSASSKALARAKALEKHGVKELDDFTSNIMKKESTLRGTKITPIIEGNEPRTTGRRRSLDGTVQMRRGSLSHVKMDTGGVSIPVSGNRTKSFKKRFKNNVAKTFDFRQIGMSKKTEEIKDVPVKRRRSILKQTRKTSLEAAYNSELKAKNRRRASLTAKLIEESMKGLPSSDKVAPGLTETRARDMDSQRIMTSGSFSEKRGRGDSTQAKHLLLRVVILPDSKFRLRWDFLILLLVIFYAYIIPLRLAELSPIPDSKNPMFYFDILFTIIFILDIFLNCITAYRMNGLLVLDRGKIIEYYARTWLAVDIVAIFPFEMFEGANESTVTQGRGPSGQMNKLLRLLRLFKLTRILRLNRIANRAEDNVKVDTNTVRLAKLAFVLVLVWHFTACAYWYISLYEGMGTSNIYFNLTGKFDEWVAPRELLTIPAYNTTEFKYVLSFYWAVMTTMGNGRDVKPETLIEIIISVIAIVFGLGIYAVIIGGVTSALANMDSFKTTRGQKLEDIKEYLNLRSVPNDLKSAIRQYYIQNWENESNTGSNPVLRELHASLHLELNTYLYKDIIESVPVFQMIENNDCVLELIEKLIPRLCVPSETVIREGTVGQEMYIIVKGMMDVWKYSEEEDKQMWITRLPRKNVVGEASLLTRETRNASVTSVGYTELLVLEKRDFDSVMLEYPELLRAMQRVASGKLEGWDRVRALIKSAKTMRAFGLYTDFHTALLNKELTQEQKRQIKMKRTALWKTQKGRESIFVHRLNDRSKRSVQSLLVHSNSGSKFDRKLGTHRTLASHRTNSLRSMHSRTNSLRSMNSKNIKRVTSSSSLNPRSIQKADSRNSPLNPNRNKNSPKQTRSRSPLVNKKSME